MSDKQHKYSASIMENENESSGLKNSHVTAFPPLAFLLAPPCLATPRHSRLRAGPSRLLRQLINLSFLLLEGAHSRSSDEQTAHLRLLTNDEI